MEEMEILVFYDVPDDKTRNKIGEKLKDYGLKRIQFSGFSGRLNRVLREKLKETLKAIVGDKEAVVYIQPICSKCLDDSLIIENSKEIKKENKIFFGMKTNRLYRDYED
jgi:CRISPR-associated endonuclease Cas2